MLRIGVYGVGAIGSLICGKLAPFASMFAIVKKNQINEFCRNGVCIEGAERISVSSKQTSMISPMVIKALTQGTELQKPLDILIVTVKSTATQDVSAEIQKSNWIDKHSVLISLQNGIGNQDILAQGSVRPQQVIQGVTYIGATGRLGRVTPCGLGETILSGSSEASYDEKLELVKEVFQRADLSCSIAPPEQMQTMIWTKLIVNAAISPLAAVLNGPNKTIITGDDATSLMRCIVHESVQVAEAKGITLGFQKDPYEAVADVADKTGNNICSMLTDLRNGKKTEIDVINQAIVRYGQEANIPTPYNEMMVKLIRALEEQELRCL